MSKIANYQAERNSRKTAHWRWENKPFVTNTQNVKPSDNAPTELYEKRRKRFRIFGWFTEVGRIAKNCKQLIRQKLFPRFAKKDQSLKCRANALARRNRYKAPKIQERTERIETLDLQTNGLLWGPLNIHTGDYIRQRSGYRQKGGMFRLSWSQKQSLYRK